MLKNQPKLIKRYKTNRANRRSVSGKRQITAFMVAAFLLFQHLLIITPNIGGGGIVKAAVISPNIVISQVYGGGVSSSSAPVPAYTNDYIELFNISNTAVNISGWSLQYGSSTGMFGSSSGNIYTFPATTSVPAGRNLLVKLGSTVLFDVRVI